MEQETSTKRWLIAVDSSDDELPKQVSLHF